MLSELSVDCGDVPAWLTAVAAIVGLFFVWRQLGGLNKQLKLQTYSDYTRRYEAIVMRLPEDVNSADFKLEGRGDYNQTMRAMRSYFDLCFEEWDLNEKKLIDPQFWETWQDGIRTAMSKTAFRQAWSVISSDSEFGERFEAFLDDLPGQAALKPDVASTGGAS